MNFTIHNPYKQIWSTLLIILLVSFLGFNRTVDLQQHDTYFVFSLGHLGMLLTFSMILIGGVYWLLRKKELVSWMTKGYVSITNFSAIILILLGFLFKPLLEFDHGFFQNYNIIFLLTLTLFLLVQVLLILNLVISLFKN